MKFSELGILPALESALAKEDIVETNAIQEKAIPLMLDGQDVYISSETGTGKTLAYLLPLLSKLDCDSKGIQAVILTPTYELAAQIQDQLVRLRQNSTLDFRSMMVIGSAALKRQLEKLKSKPQIIVGSTGRILELLKMKKIKVSTVKTLVIDEADKMLLSESLGMMKDLQRAMLKDRQMVFVSATNLPATNQVAADMSANLMEAHTQSNQISDNITHIAFIAHENERPKLLCKVIHACDPERAIVFTHRNETAKRIARKLAEHGMEVGEIHGDCDKQDRVNAINQFRLGKIKILVASDMAARGLDVKGVTHIFNIDVPGKSRDYLHRAGRTGRAGEHGYCISFMSGVERKVARRYQRDLDIAITKASIYKGVIRLHGDLEDPGLDADETAINTNSEFK
jgi:superfamily II DNA/RNA helicase